MEKKDNELSTDKKEKIVAIKIYKPNEEAQEEMKKFELNPLSLIKYEALDLKACSFVVPRRYEEDENGVPFLVMPYHPRTLADAKRNIHFWNGSRMIFNGETALEISKDLVNGLAEVHTSLGIVHGDWKDQNVLRGEGKWLVTDFSLSPLARSISQGQERGHRYTRAPECFSTPTKKGKDVDPRADVFGNAALIYSLYGEGYPLGKELSKLEPSEYGNFIGSLSIKEGNKLIGDRIKENNKMPKEIKRILTQALSFDPRERFADGPDMLKALEENMSAYTFKGSLKRAAKLGIGVGLAGMGIGTAIVMSQYMGDDNSRVSQRRMEGYFNPTIIGTNSIAFTRESLSDLPAPAVYAGWGAAGNEYIMETIAKRNVNLGYFFKGYLDAQQKNRKIDVTQEQRDIWNAHSDKKLTGDEYPRMDHQIVAKNIEIALTQSVNSNGFVKIEDVCSIGYVGLEKVNRAKQLSQSSFFRNYIYAKDPNGKYLIGENEQDAIRSWVSQINYQMKYSGITPTMPANTPQAKD